MQGCRDSVGIDLDGSASIRVVAEAGVVNVEQLELGAAGGLRALHPVAATQQVVGDLAGGRPAGVADDDGGAADDLDPVDKSGVVRGACTAPTPGFNLDLGAGVGKLHQPSRPVEHDALEGGEKAERVDVDAEFVDNSSQLLALSRLIELHLVADHGVEMAERLGPLPDQVEEVG